MRLWQSVVGGLGAGLVALAAGCSGGGGGDGGGSDPDVGAKDLFVVDMDLDQRDGVSLNTPLSIEFSEFVMPNTVRHDTVQVRLGPRFGIQSFGDFKIDGNVVTFFPQLPTKADLSDAGFQPQSSYRVTVAGHPKINRVKSYSGRPLVRTYIGEFATAASTSPDLFTVNTYKDPPPPGILFTNPPDVLPTAPWTTPGGATGVNTDAEIQMVFNRVPLLPSTITT
ncbi:MAG TPA: Ig-like domain-containing protein, partial [Planctomycetota bacterium]|nr:Ig-like domain-containing protein [Planctomycetota bacterium]